MTENSADPSGIIINIPASLIAGQSNRATTDTKRSLDHGGFSRTGVSPIQVERNTEHGKTNIQSLGLKDSECRQKILHFLDLPGLYGRLPQLFDYIYQLGAQPDAEQRYFAAVAVCELSVVQSFSDLKKAIILPWATSNDPFARYSASVTLAHSLEQARHSSEVMALLKYWINCGNPLLADTAISTLFRVAPSYPTEALSAVRKIVTAGRILHYPAAIELFGAVYDADASRAIDDLYRWMIPPVDSDLCWLSCILTLMYLRIEDAIKNEATRGQVSEMIFHLWDDTNLRFHEQLHEHTTFKLEQWTSEVISLWNKESPEVIGDYLAFFHRLHQQYAGQRRNRLEFHLQRWQRSRDRNQQRAARKTGEAPGDPAATPSYLDLVPHRCA